MLCFSPILPIKRFYSHYLPIWTWAALAGRGCHWFPWIYIIFEGNSSSSENNANVMKILHPYNLQAIHWILLAVFALSCVHVSLGAVLRHYRLRERSSDPVCSWRHGYMQPLRLGVGRGTIRHPAIHWHWHVRVPTRNDSSYLSAVSASTAATNSTPPQHTDVTEHIQNLRERRAVWKRTKPNEGHAATGKINFGRTENNNDPNNHQNHQ